MAQSNTYVGLDKEDNGGMTSIGKIIRDAWVFGVLEETEMCENWDISRFNALLDDVNKEWDKYGCMVSNLPPELMAKHKRIYDEAIKRAKAAGWSGERETNDET